MREGVWPGDGNQAGGRVVDLFVNPRRIFRWSLLTFFLLYGVAPATEYATSFLEGPPGHPKFVFGWGFSAVMAGVYSLFLCAKQRRFCRRISALTAQNVLLEAPADSGLPARFSAFLTGLPMPAAQLDTETTLIRLSGGMMKPAAFLVPAELTPVFVMATSGTPTHLRQIHHGFFRFRDRELKAFRLVVYERPEGGALLGFLARTGLLKRPVVFSLAFDTVAEALRRAEREQQSTSE